MGALSITATNAGAIPCALDMRSVSETVGIGTFTEAGNVYNSFSDEVYLTPGPQSELDFRNECKDYERTHLVFRQEIKTTHEKCEGIGDVCLFNASAGCGIEDGSTLLYCKCEIKFNYCTQTTEGIGSEDKIERSFGGKN